MDKVKVRKSDLLEVVQKNHEQHVADYNTALAGWREKVLLFFSTTYEQLRSQKESFDRVEFCPHVKPESHEKDYNRVIRMLELSCDDVIELEQAEFEKYVMDEWAWAQSFNMTKTLYNSTKR